MAALTDVPDGAEAGSAVRVVGAELDPERVVVRRERGRSAVAAVAVHEARVLVWAVPQLFTTHTQTHTYIYTHTDIMYRSIVTTPTFRPVLPISFFFNSRILILTVGLASHWPCVTDNSGITTYGLTASGREMSKCQWSMAHFTIFLPCLLEIDDGVDPVLLL